MSIEKPCFILIDPEVFESKDEIDEFISAQQAVNTKYNTNFAVNVLMRFCKENNETQRFEILPKSELDNLLCNFFMKIRI